jgi:hypothetical protein
MVTDENDDDCELPFIEQLLYTTLQKESFAAEDQPLNKAIFEVRDRTTSERGGSLDDNGSAPGGTQAVVQVSTLSILYRENRRPVFLT